MKKDHADKKEKLKTEAADQDDAVATETEETDSASDFEEIKTALTAEISKLKEEYLRVLAESENIKKRCAAEIEKNNKYAVSSFAKDLLGVADNLSRALEAGNVEQSPECQGILKGVELTNQELTHVFEKFGVSPIESMGKKFDPNYHRVVQEIENPDQPSGTIIAELQKGYLINGRILREAMVVVTKGGNA